MTRYAPKMDVTTYILILNFSDKTWFSAGHIDLAIDQSLSNSKNLCPSLGHGGPSDAVVAPPARPRPRAETSDQRNRPPPDAAPAVQDDDAAAAGGPARRQLLRLRRQRHRVDRPAAERHRAGHGLRLADAERHAAAGRGRVLGAVQGVDGGATQPVPDGELFLRGGVLGAGEF